MGFSVSGSAAIVFAALFIAFGMWHSAATNGFERVSEAQGDRADAALDERNTDVVIDSVTYDGEGTLTVQATNEGATALSLNATDLLVDNEYTTGWRGDALADPTDLWLPGEQVTVEIDGLSGPPGRVKLVTEHGVARAEVVS